MADLDFSNQVDPMLNISPLIDIFSECLTRVVDTDGIFHLPAHDSPIILSHKRRLLNSSRTYQQSFAGVRSPRCLLTVLSFFVSWTYNLEALLNPTFIEAASIATSAPTRNFVRIYPETFLILTNNTSSFNILRSKLEGSCHDNDRFPLLVALQLHQDNPRISGTVLQMMHHGLTFKCSTLESCGKELNLMMPVLAKIFIASWRFQSFGRNFSGGDPFERETQVGIEKAMDSFILGPQSQHPTPEAQCAPIFFFQNGYVSSPRELIPTGRTPAVKFVTTVGVFASETSCRVYISPFLPTVWLATLVSAVVTLVTIAGALQMQRTRKGADIGVLKVALEIATWILASTFGQFKHSGLPPIPGRSHRAVICIVAPVVISWFILSTFLVNVYLAVFNSDATQPFNYFTNYSKFLQLPVHDRMYVLVNESYVRQYEAEKAVKECLIEGYKPNSSFCGFHNFAPFSCNIYEVINNAIMLVTLAEERINASSTGWNNKSNRLGRLREKRLKLGSLRTHLRILCASISCLSDILLQLDNPVTFLMSEHDIQKYWQFFVHIMQKHPKVKVANNFYSDEAFLSEAVSVEFKSGMHPAFKEPVLTRMKLLLSSGIYDLWQKWHRIKFTAGGLQHAVKKVPRDHKVSPLSFGNSGTSWVFQAQAFGWLVATGIFIGERTLRVVLRESLAKRI